MEDHPHTHPIPIPMGISIPTAALFFALGKKRQVGAYGSYPLYTLALPVT